jgi:site-specific DNA-methyltransferase (cytosine-N4-specific)
MAADDGLVDISETNDRFVLTMQSVRPSLHEKGAPELRRIHNRSVDVTCEVKVGDSLKILQSIPDNTFQCCVTSPPYWGLRDYGIDGQIGAETTVKGYLDSIVSVFEEVRRTLKPDGTLWLNIGDAYTSGGRTWRDGDKKNPARGMSYRAATPEGLKPKDLIGIPWKMAFALQEAGWYLRSDIVWNKPNAQPESVKDRPTRSHEFVFLMSKSEKYYYDHAAVVEPTVEANKTRNRRSVWSINTEPSKEAHFAMFPPKLVELCIQAGSQPESFVLDPFFGAGTVGMVASRMGRNCIGIELKDEYAAIARGRLKAMQPHLQL